MESNTNHGFQHGLLLNNQDNDFINLIKSAHSGIGASSILMDNYTNHGFQNGLSLSNKDDICIGDLGSLVHDELNTASASVGISKK